MSKRLLTAMLLLAVETGCPHAFGRDGTIDMAMRKDMAEYYKNRNCPMPIEEWEDLCDNQHGHETQPECPKECEPPR